MSPPNLSLSRRQFGPTPPPPPQGLSESMETEDVSRPKSRIKTKHPHNAAYGAGRH
jgi:hypothetical protein